MAEPADDEALFTELDSLQKESTEQPGGGINLVNYLPFDLY